MFRLARRCGIRPGTVPFLLALFLLSCFGWAEPSGAEETGAAGRIVDLKGKVAVKTVTDQAPVVAESGRFLKAGDTVLTGADGWAAILLADETLVQVNKNTTFILREVTARAGWFKSREVVPASATPSTSLYRVESGEAWFRNKNPNGSIRIETPSVTAALRGTELNILIQPDRTSIVTVLEGAIGAYNDAGSVQAGAREQVVAALGAAPKKILLIEPEKAVQWTLTLPDIVRPRDVPLTGGDRQALESAKKEWTARSAAQPSDADALIRLGQVQRDLGLASEAARSFEKALALSPQNPEALAGMGWVCLDANDPRSALNYLQKIPQPAGPTATLGLVLACRQTGDSRSAETILNAGLSRYPDFRPLALQAVLMRIENREPEQARELASRIAGEHPEDALAWSLLALIDLTRGDLDRAVRESDRATEQSPSTPVAWIVKSYVCQGRFDLEGATAAVKKALSLDGQNVLALVNLAKLQFGSGYPEKAMDTVESAGRLAPRSGEVLNLKGFLLLAGRKTEAAIRTFKKALEVEPGLGEAHLGLALATMRQGNVPEALEEISAAIVLEPRRSLFLSYWAKMLYQVKRFDQALDILQMAARLDPRDPTPDLYRGIILRDLNRPTEAIESINRAMALNDNRAVYRSRFLLDQDLAVKSVDLSILYSQLGLTTWSMNKALASIKYDYTNFAGHMFYAGGLFQDEALGRVASNEALLGRMLMPANPNAFNTYSNYTELFETPSIHGEITGTVGSFHNYEYDAILYGGSPQLNAAFTASVGHTETRGWRPTNPERSTFGGAIVKWDPTTRDSLMFASSTLDNNRGDSLNAPFSYSYPGDPFNRGDSYLLRFELGYHHNFAPDTDLLLFYTNADNRGASWDRTVYYPLFTPDVYYDIRSQSQFKTPYNQFQAQQHFRFGDHQFIVGTLHFFGEKDVDYKEDWYLNFYGTPYYLANFYSNYGLPTAFHSIYAEDIWRVTNTLTVEAAAYMDFMHQSNAFTGTEWDITEFDPRLGIIWNPVKAHTFRLAAFRYTLPIFSVRLDPQEVAGVPIFRNNIEGSVTEEADFTHEFEWSTGLLSTNLFYLKRSLDYKLETDGPFFTDHGHAKGVRTTLNQLLWKGMGLSAGYTFMDVQDDENPAMARYDHRLFGSLSYLHSSGLSAFATQSLRYFDLKQAGLAGQQIWLTDIGIGYELPDKKGRLRLAVYNLLDRHFDWVVDPYIFEGRIPRRQVVFTVALDF